MDESVFGPLIGTALRKWAIWHPFPCSLGANPIQEEINGSLSMPLLGFWIRCDAVVCEALGMPEHKIEEHVSRKFRVIYLDLTAGRGLTQYT
jgi:hypothetical protein